MFRSLRTAGQLSRTWSASSVRRTVLEVSKGGQGDAQAWRREWSVGLRGYLTAEAKGEPISMLNSAELSQERMGLLQGLFLSSGAKGFESSITCQHLEDTLLKIVGGEEDPVTHEIIQKARTLSLFRSNASLRF